MPIKHVSVSSAIIGGSTGFKFLEKHHQELEPLDRIATPFGNSAPVFLCSVSGMQFLYISRHGEKGYDLTASFINYRANIWALKELGVRRIVSWSGPAAIDPKIKIGEIVVPGDLVDETKQRNYTFFEGLGLGFIRQSPTFCPEISNTLSAVVQERFGLCRTEDTYVCTEGPRLETPAEIRKFTAYGGSLVGMTLVPEVFLAKELEMCYAAICYITNYAEGVRERSFKSGVLFEGLLDEDETRAVDRSAIETAEIAIATLALLDKMERTCSCGKLMDRYKRRGSIGDDWRSWIKKQDTI